MPNTGKPSKDCELCRSRRVKCDLGRPSCQRCIKYGVQCPGYRNLQELVFRDPVTVAGISGSGSGSGHSSGPASNVAKKQRAARKTAARAGAAMEGTSTATSSPALDHDDSDALSAFSFQPQTQSSEITDLVVAQWPLHVTMMDHWTNRSIPIMLELYSSLGFLHDAFKVHHDDGPLLWAAHLFSRTYVTNLQAPTSTSEESRLETQQELGMYLGKTLSSISAALRSPDGASRDDVLATVWILANYEILLGTLKQGFDHSSPWHLHTRGIYSILKARGNKQLSTLRGRMAFWPSFNMLQIQAIIGNVECPPETDEWLGIIKSTMDPDEHFAIHTSIFVKRVAAAQAHIMRLLADADHQSAIKQYAGIVDEINTAFREMEEIYPEHPVEAVLDHYLHLMHSSVVVKVHAVLQLLINFLTHQPHCPIPLDELRAQWHTSLQLIRDKAAVILAATPVFTAKFAMSNDMAALFEGLKVIWPLTSICTTAGTLPEQKRAAAELLIVVGHRSGVRQAFNNYQNNSKFPTRFRQPRFEEIDG